MCVRYKGLTSLIGPAGDDMDEAVCAEHCEEADSFVEFTTGNYGVLTTSATEYWFVVDPVGAASTPRIHEAIRRDARADPKAKVGRMWDWPVEEKLRDDPEQRSRCRQPLPAKDFAEARAELDAQLVKLGYTPIRDVEFFGARLYTGPLFEKYCAVLRGIPGFSAFLTNKYHELCMGNRYCSTIHAINDAFIKMSRVTKAENLYRGVGGFRLPDTFLTPDAWNVRGGVEFGFMSATTDREVAVTYAGGRGSGIVYEISQVRASPQISVAELALACHL